MVSEGGRESQRLGLGLYITRQIVLAHGGTLSFEIQRRIWNVLHGGHSSTHERWGTQTDLPAVDAKRIAGGATIRAEKTILIVEDEDGARIALGRLLRDRGYHVLVASAPSEALTLVDGHAGPVQLLLTDVRLPEMGGEELAARLRNSQPHLEVIFMSGLAETPAGASASLQKPIDVDALTEVIERVLA